MKTRVINNDKDLTSRNELEGVEYALAHKDLYIAKKSAFNSLYFHLKTPASTALDYTLKYYDGSNFVEFGDTIDKTLGFTQSGQIILMPKENVNYMQYLINSKDILPALGKELLSYYWVKVEFSAIPTELEIDEVGYSFATDADLNGIASDLEDIRESLGQDDWSKQLKAASKIAVEKLKNQGIIEETTQLLAPSEWAIAVSYKALAMIFGEQGEAYEPRAKAAEQSFKDLLKPRGKAIDTNRDGIRSETDRVESYRFTR